jgi:hypothetical protein
MTQEEKALKIAGLDGWEFNELTCWYDKGSDTFSGTTLILKYNDFNGLMPIWLRLRDDINIGCKNIEVFKKRCYLVSIIKYETDTFIDALQDAIIFVLDKVKETEV